MRTAPDFDDRSEDGIVATFDRDIGPRLDGALCQRVSVRSFLDMRRDALVCVSYRLRLTQIVFGDRRIG